VVENVEVLCDDRHNNNDSTKHSGPFENVEVVGGVCKDVPLKHDVTYDSKDVDPPNAIETLETRGLSFLTTQSQFGSIIHTQQDETVDEIVF
jgi:hypothetical protein